MKKIIFAVLLLIAAASTNGQTPATKNASGIYTTKSVKAKPTNTGQKYLHSDGQTYPIYESKNGKFYVNVPSKKTGKIYRKYLILN